MMATASFNHFPQISEQLHKRLKQVVKMTALDGRKFVRAQIKANGQVDTGLMLKSVYATGASWSTYSRGIGPRASKRTGINKVSRKRKQAHIRKLKQLDMLLNEVAANPGDELTAYFAVAAYYGVYQNYGTRRLPARPFWEPGVERTNQALDERLAKVAASLGEGGSVSGAIEMAPI